MKRIIAFVLAANISGVIASDTSDPQKNPSMFEHHIETQVEINTTEMNVWRVLMAFENYQKWNPFITAISGRPEIGQKLSVQIQPVGGNSMSFSPEILELKPEKMLRWKGRFLMPGLFDGEHYFVIRKETSGKIIFVQGENFSGLLVPFFKTQLDTGTKTGFHNMNEALRQQAEILKH